MQTPTARYPRRYHSEDLEHQIGVLRSLWPKLQPDRAWDYINDVLPELPVSEGAEAPFCLINPSFFGSRTRAIDEVTRALASQRHRPDKPEREDKFEDFCTQTYAKGGSLEGFIQPRDHTLMAEKSIALRQPGDLWIVQAQFGKRHCMKSASEVRASMTPSEFGLGISAVGCMILTHRSRFVHPTNVQAECMGDRFASRLPTKLSDQREEETRMHFQSRRKDYMDESFSLTPYFGYSRGKLILDAFDSDFQYNRAGTVTGFIPER